MNNVCVIVYRKKNSKSEKKIHELKLRKSNVADRISFEFGLFSNPS